MRDIGILARLSRGGNRYFVIAGLHSYGTWITASFLDSKILRGHHNEKKHSDVFYSDVDFIAVIVGDFQEKTMKVEFSDVDGNKLWIKKNNRWYRIDRADV